MKRTAKTILVLCAVVALSVSACKKDDDNATANTLPVVASAATFPASTTSLTFPTFNSTNGTFSWSDGSVAWSGVDSQGVINDAKLYYPVALTSGDAYDHFGYLHIQTTSFGQPYEPQHTGVALEDSSLEIVYPPQNLMGLDVSRKIYSNPTPSYTNSDIFIRFLDILTNNTAAPITVKVIFAGNVGSDSSTNIVGDTNGDYILEEGVDNWFITGEGTLSAVLTDPIDGHLVDGSTAYDKADTYSWITNSTVSMLPYWWTGYATTPYAISTIVDPASSFTASWSISSDNFLYNWDNVTLQPGEKKVLMHLELLALDTGHYAGSPGLAGLITSMGELESAPAKVISAMDASEINAVINFPAARNNCNVRGGPGAATARVLVTVANVTQGTSAQSYSLGDGSYGVCINAASGNTLWLTDGAHSATVIVP